MQTISTFTNIQLYENTLVILDIDETLLRYENIDKKWWKDRFNYYYNIHNHSEKSDECTINDWLDFIKTSNPTHTDKEGFVDLEKRIDDLNCKLIFVTARNKELEAITHTHFDHLEIKNKEIYFTSGENKAHTIENVINKYLRKHEHVIFVDDLDTNLNDVNQHFENKIKCFKFETIY